MKIKLQIITVTLLIFSLKGLPAQEPVTVNALILDVNDQKPVGNARIIIKGISKTFRTDNQGKFQAQLPDKGSYTIRIIAGEKLEQQSFNIQYNNQEIKILFGISQAQKPKDKSDESDSYTTSGSIYVFGNRDKTSLSRHRLSKKEIRRLPGAYGDSLSGVQTLPGVTRAPSVGVGPSSNIKFENFVNLGVSLGPPYSNSVGSGYLVIRGSGPRSSRVYLDGMPVMYPYHLGDQSSVINNDFIQAIDVYTGSFPVKYGNATGGILSIEGPAEVEKNGGHINVSLFLTDVYYENQLSENVFAVGAARKSYPNVFLLKTVPNAIPENALYADYSDGQFKMGWRLHPEHSLMYLAFMARDILNYTQSIDQLDGDEGDFLSSLGFIQDRNNTNTNGRPPVGLDRKFLTHGLRYDMAIDKLFQNQLTASVSYFQEDFEVRFDSPATGESIFDFYVVDGRRESIVRDEFYWPLYKDYITFSAGAEWADYSWNMHLRDVTPKQTRNTLTEGFDSIIRTLLDTSPSFRALYDGDKNDFFVSSGWTQLELEFWRIRIVPGVRAEKWSLSDSRAVGPRILGEFHIKETGTTLQAAAGRHFAIPLEQNIISRQAGNPWLEMEESDHSVIGIEQSLGKSWAIKIEGFRNQFRNLVVEDDFIVNPWSLRTAPREWAEEPGDVISDPYENRYLGYSNDGTGYSNGFEVLIKKIHPSTSVGFFGWLSYTYSISKRNNNQTRLSDDEKTAFLAKKNNNQVVAYFETSQGPILFYDSGETDFYYNNDSYELYDLDRTHQISVVAGYMFSKNWQVGLRWVYQTNTPITPIENHDDLGNAGGFQVYFPEYSKRYNSDRLHPFHQLDLRVDHFEHYGWGYANYFIEFINVYARENPERQNWDYQSPYRRGSNPSVSHSVTYIKYGGSDGSPGPLINMGLELRF